MNLRAIADETNRVHGTRYAPEEIIATTGADLLLAGDLGCLMNMAGKLSRRGSRVRAFHAIEVLAGLGQGPAIGEEG